ncbi:right-handed parallel beta-helix repeat-containing protein [bacterium]|nr:right-handed parallel beta-helix repeat-containing protein [bacterium]
MKKQINLKHRFSNNYHTGLILVVSVLLSSCSSGLRVRNLLNYPLDLSSLEALDTLKISPDVVNYTGAEISSFRNFEKDIRIRGKQNARPVWMGSEQGCFSVNGGATVHITDFNFRGAGSENTLIKLDSANLILENCDFGDSDMWSIEVGSQATLELRNVRFINLGLGAIHLDGGQIKLFNSTFDMAGKTAIRASRGKLFEAHKVTITNTMGSGLELNSVSEVWLDTVGVIDSFQDGILLEDCPFVLINEVEARGNGRNGLYLKNSTIGGLLNFRAVGNLVNGMVISDVDTLRILNSEFTGNGESGASLERTAKARMAGVRVGHNGQEGFKISHGNELLIHHSTFQANPTLALSVDSLNSVHIENVSFVNNGNGLQVTDFEEIKFRNNLISSNGGNAAFFRSGKEVTSRNNLVKSNQKGLLIEDVLNVGLDSNRVESNVMGTDLRSISRLTMSNNLWVNNKSASYFSDMGYISSTHDSWKNNSINAFEILSAEDFILSNAILTNNQDAGLINQASARFETCVFDSGSGYGIKLMNGLLEVNGSKFRSNSTAIELAEGSRAKIVQSQFANCKIAVDAQASVSFSMSFSKIYKAHTGIRVGNYANIEILSNQFDEIADYSILATGPHLQSLLLRQNIFQHTGGILRSSSISGLIKISSNTFVSNSASLKLMPETLELLDHNIFYQTEIDEFKMLRGEQAMRWNCFFPGSAADYPLELREQNLFTDPAFDEQYYLSSHSACLQGGHNGLAIGALGLLPEKRPDLIP